MCRRPSSVVRHPSSVVRRRRCRRRRCRHRCPSVPIEFPRTYVNYCMYVLTLLSVLSNDNYLCMINYCMYVLTLLSVLSNDNYLCMISVLYNDTYVHNE